MSLSTVSQISSPTAPPVSTSRLQPKAAQLVQFLRQQLGISDRELAIVLRDSEVDIDNDNLSILLWGYGLITMEQLGQIFDWRNTQRITCPVLQYIEITS